MAMHCDSCLWKENQFLFLNRESRFVKKKKKLKKLVPNGIAEALLEGMSIIQVTVQTGEG